MPKTATALLVLSPEHRLSSLQSELEPLVTDLLIARNCAEARHLLQTCSSIDVIVTDLAHPDGSWQDVFVAATENLSDAEVVVTSPLADERLWSVVLWLGGYDILAEPYDSREVKRVVEGALHKVQMSRLGSKLGKAVPSEV